MSVDEHGRPEPDLTADERGTLLGFLEYQRATLRWKCERLTSEQLRFPLAPTAMTLAGLLAHLGTVEDFWFSTVVAEQPFPAHLWPDGTADDPKWEWAVAPQMEGDELRRRWEEACERSRAVLTEATDLSAVHPAWGGKVHVSTRWVLVHMIEEYARHNGHADLLREAVDGETGE